MNWEHDHHCDHSEDIVIECGGEDNVNTRIALGEEEDDHLVNRYKELKITFHIKGLVGQYIARLYN